MQYRTSVALLTVAFLAAASLAHAHDLPADAGLSGVVANDNRTPAGTRTGNTLVLNLRAARGRWQPEGTDGPTLVVETFGEVGGGLQTPAPLIRVPEGTEVALTIRNDLDAMLRVAGLCTRDGSPCTPLEVPPGGERQVSFAAGQPGTYHYWATTTGMPLGFRAVDAQLSGAFIVDPKGASVPSDRVLVITEWASITRAQLREIAAADDPGVMFRALDPRFTFVINGLAWPATERLSYQLGDEIRWRVVNLSTQPHPMHLHGFYFDVDSIGNGIRDQVFDERSRQRAVTQLLPSGGTMEMTWKAERVGNWLFHCHISEHIAPERRLSDGQAGGDAHGAHDAGVGMAGMVLGVSIVDPAALALRTEPLTAPARQMTLVMRTEPGRFGDRPAFGFALSEGVERDSASLSIPGPTLTLHRGEPVEITLVNELPEPTAIHWHGLELESYYDGVHGWSGSGSRLTPLIAPGERFTVRFTPPHAGTFIYHTHLHDDHQLPSGMYGALIVLDEGERFDPALDHVVVIGRAGPGLEAPVVLNGQRDPLLSWKAGVRHRIRLINITPGDVLVAALSKTDGAVTWRPLTKDGAPVSAALASPRPATQTIAVGETYDFEYEAPPGRQSMWLEVRSSAGRWMVQGRVVTK